MRHWSGKAILVTMIVLVASMAWGEQKTVEELRAIAMDEGMKTLLQDGIEKVFAGHCDLLMVRKVCIA